MTRRAAAAVRCAVLYAVAWAIGCAPLVGCTETRIVGWRPMLGGLPGANTGVPVAPAKAPPLPASIAGSIEDIEPGSEGLVSENDDGVRTLILRSGRDLMYHIVWTLEEGERELFTQQVLSSVTRAEFLERGLDPAEAFDMLAPNQRGIRRLFARMPQAEFTPGMIMKAVGGGTYRLQVRPGPDLTFSGMDMVNESGRWRLRWFVR